MPEPVVIDTTEVDEVLQDVSFIVKIGEEWSQELPPLPKLSQSYSSVDLSKVSSFMTYDEKSLTLTIDPSKTDDS